MLELFSLYPNLGFNKILQQAKSNRSLLRYKKEVSQINGVNIRTLTAPPIEGLGSIGGFFFVIKQASRAVQEVDRVRNEFLIALQ
ncbi:MAG: hypothetical protein ACMUEM_01715 [Flavobacteriales bacterium AspAUS03]